MIPARPLTLDDVGRLAANDERHRFELTEGNLVIRPPDPWRHQRVIGLIAAWFLASRYGDRVNIKPGVKTAADDLNGRIPDLVVTAEPVADEVVWVQSNKVALAVEVVSRGSERTDRWVKPVEYAAVGIPRFWRVESDEKVQQFELRDGTYVETATVPLAELLDGDVPDLT